MNALQHDNDDFRVPEPRHDTEEGDQHLCRRQNSRSFWKIKNRLTGNLHRLFTRSDFMVLMGITDFSSVPKE